MFQRNANHPHLNEFAKEINNNILFLCKVTNFF